ncbi:MAG: carboxypeptidase-like regulatory domain-containing protein [Chthoniobacterales bacterium]
MIDQNGDPVPDAKIVYGATDKFDADGSNYHGKSDADGNFSISGIKGVVLTVGVAKAGYYHIHGKSNGAFAYAMDADSQTRPPPTKENPAIFLLQKMGATEPLIKVESGLRISRNGAPVEISLATGRLKTPGDFRVEAWTHDETPDAKGHYDWRCRVSVPNGGLVERTGQFDFQAPQDGYKSSDEIKMPVTAKEWHPACERSYFIRLSDGRYARVQFEMIAGGNHYFQIEAYLNPAPGSRNLEFDPEKQVKAR